ncbi:hypothetical protein F0562_015357 [Nyssa sinensis]|uniref:DUF7036 domain-containing protein n=1 Tax=Nyssa sinensis TaxID=561372 RepID=A0A5J4ZGT6_9ASTE|nr:hypothetical protein F0562_015357 [Nyssa sinensis]
MGKVEEEQSLPTTVNSQNTEQNAENRCKVPRLVAFRCILALVMGVAVLLSAIFWLPPFLRYRDQRDLDLDSQFKDHDIVACFMVGKPVSFLEDNILQLGDDIFDEIGVPTTKVFSLSLSLSLSLPDSIPIFPPLLIYFLQQVEVLSLESTAGSNITKVVFAVDPDLKNARVSSTAQSLTRASFESLVIRQSSLQLTPSLFGVASSFEVLKFPGGITISPPQRAFLLQKVQIFFNFTLNFSIKEIQDNFNELTSQLKSGLHLAPYENLYISLTNSKGSTVAPPTTVQASVLLAVGNPSISRLKQLAQTITGSHSKNLGLSNTVFGRVKQVHLSSILPHSLGGDGSPTPAPLPLPHPHHHHHHHHLHHHHASHLAPAPTTEKSAAAPAAGKSAPVAKGLPTYAPVPTPAPEKSHEAKPPGCHFGHKGKFPRKPQKQSHLLPPVAPPSSPQHVAPSPHQQVISPAPVSHPIPASSPVPNVVFAHVQPPSKSGFDVEPPDIAPSVSPSPSSSSAGCVPTVLWTIPLFLALVLHLQQQK